MNTGQLDQRVTVERLVGDDVDMYGQPIATWTPVCTVWAAVEPLTGREYLAASAFVSEVTTRIRLRYRPGVTVTDRVIHEGTIYGITSLINYKSGNRELLLMCRG